LAQALLPLLDKDPERAAELAKQELSKYESRLNNDYLRLMRAKLGLFTEKSEDGQFMADLFSLMSLHKVDYTALFRNLSGQDSLDSSQQVAAFFSPGQAYLAWAKKYRQRLAEEAVEKPEWRAHMNAVNPKFVLRTHLAQEVILKAQQGDYQFLNEVLAVLQSPFSEHDAYASLAEPPPNGSEIVELSCSS
jgi:uncharacterized protein YdiU (UPF0061 family)